MSLVDYIGAEAQPARRDARALPAAEARRADAHQPRTREAAPRQRAGDFSAATLSTLCSRRLDGAEGLRKAHRRALQRAPAEAIDGRRQPPRSSPTAASTPTGAHPGAAGRRRRAPPPDPRTARARKSASSSSPASRARCMHFALLIGYGAAAVNPYLGLETIADMMTAGRLLDETRRRTSAAKNYIKAVNKGLLKIMSKMGISTLRSYRGAQIFEAIGLTSAVVDRYFTGTASRIEGIGLDDDRPRGRCRHGAPSRRVPHSTTSWTSAAQYHWRRGGESTWSTRRPSRRSAGGARTRRRRRIAEYAELVNDQSREPRAPCAACSSSSRRQARCRSTRSSRPRRSSSASAPAR